jgi:hypothetical protein
LRNVVCRLWPLCFYNIFPHNSYKRHDFWKKKSGKRKMFLWFSVNFCLKYFSLWEFNQILSEMYIGLHVKWAYPSFLSDFNETWILSTEFQSTIKFHENPFSGSQADPSGQADTMKLIVVFLNFAKASNRGRRIVYMKLCCMTQYNTWILCGDVTSRAVIWLFCHLNDN